MPLIDGRCGHVSGMIAGQPRESIESRLTDQVSPAPIAPEARRRGAQSMQPEIAQFNCAAGPSSLGEFPKNGRIASQKLAKSPGCRQAGVCVNAQSMGHVDCVALFLFSVSTRLPAVDGP